MVSCLLICYAHVSQFVSKGTNNYILQTIPYLYWCPVHRNVYKYMKENADTFDNILILCAYPFRIDIGKVV
jgi:hypothetical protein